MYLKFFNRIPDWDTIPTWDEIKGVWFSWKQGTKSFLNAKTVVAAICKRLPNVDELQKRIDKIRATQTIFGERQKITLENYLAWHACQTREIPTLKYPYDPESRAKWLWCSAMCLCYGLRPSEVAAILNLDKPFQCDDGTVYPLTDKRLNPKGLIAIGEYTHFGVSTKTGIRPIAPIPDYQLIDDKLQLRDKVYQLDYEPQPGTELSSIATGFVNSFSSAMERANCPVSQLYAFRHLYNYLCELHGISQENRARRMGHTKAANDIYKTRQGFTENLAIVENSGKPQPLPYDIAIAKLQELGVDTELPDVKLILRVIYRID